jgi:restriction endonuclease S subunit
MKNELKPKLRFPKFKREKAWIKIRLGDILTLEYGGTLSESNRIWGKYPVMGSNGIVGYHKEYLIESPSIIVGRKGSAGKVTWIDKNCYPIDTTFYVKPINNKFNLKLIYYTLQIINLENLSGQTGVPGLNRNDVYSKIIPFPSLVEQKKIANCLYSIEYLINIQKQKLEELKIYKKGLMQKLFPNIKE